MLSELPREIWTRIFLQLHQDDQMECMLVCHHWNQVIERFVLYQTVFIYSTTSMAKLIKNIQQRPEIANKVEQLIINIDPRNGGQKHVVLRHHKLLHLLPNLKILETTVNGSVTNDSTRFPWCNKVQYISELPHYSVDYASHKKKYYSMAYHLLSSDTCPNLITLRICSSTFHSFKVLKNAPALTSLTIEENEPINADQLEEIHENLPHLKSLRFPYIHKIGNFTINKDVASATSVTECKFIFGRASDGFFGFQDPNEITRLLAYISKKYPNLSELTLETDSGQLSNEDSNSTNTNVWTPLLQKLGPRLKKLCFHFEESIAQVNFDQNDVGIRFHGHHGLNYNILDRSGCKINYLSLDFLNFRKLFDITKLQQALYIQTLVLKQTECRSFEWLKDFRVLRKLKLVNCVYCETTIRISLDVILKNTPSTLDSLSLEEIRVTFDSHFTGTSNIKTLSFNDIEFRGKMITAMFQCFPKLSKLKLQYCDLEGKKFNLETMDLFDFRYAECSPGKHNMIVSIQTLANKEQRLYFVENNNLNPISNPEFDAAVPHCYLPFKSFPTSEMKNVVPHFTLICNSVKNLAFS